MDGIELRRRVDRFGQPYIKLAPRLGLSIYGLRKQMNGQRPVTRQTEIILETLEKNWVRRPAVEVDKADKVEKTERKMIQRPGGTAVG
jgi:hypothetical protein